MIPNLTKQQEKVDNFTYVSVTILSFYYKRYLTLQKTCEQEKVHCFAHVFTNDTLRWKLQAVLESTTRGQ